MNKILTSTDKSFLLYFSMTFYVTKSSDFSGFLLISNQTFHKTYFDTNKLSK